VRQKQVNFRVTQLEYEKLKAHADALGVTTAEVLRDLIKALPPAPPKKPERRSR
jgi:predicted DNA-binding protein